MLGQTEIQGEGGVSRHHLPDLCPAGFGAARLSGRTLLGYQEIHYRQHVLLSSHSIAG